MKHDEGREAAGGQEGVRQGRGSSNTPLNLITQVAEPQQLGGHDRASRAGHHPR